MEAATNGTQLDQNTPLQGCQREVEALRAALVVAREQAKVAEVRSQALERHNVELQQTLARLADSEQRYRQLLELASEGIFRVEYEQPISMGLSVEEQIQQVYQQFRVVEHNLAYAQMYGYDEPDAMVNVRLTDVHMADAPENAAQMEQFVRNGHQMRNQETVEIDRFGHKRHFLNNGFSIIRDGYAISAWGTQIDITELRETQQALLQAEQARAAELAKANEALQATIDVMADIEDLDEFIPAVLKIAAQTFQSDQTEDCAYYEHRTGDRVYLRYWLFENQVFRPEELLALDGDRFATVRRLAGGFTVPDAYLGTPVRERTQAVILDHLAGTSEPDFDEFTRNNNWHMELNVPLVVDGYADGALVIYRSPDRPFTSSEVALAESLGKQLALAMQANRLATESEFKAVETAIARAQEQAAQERAAELAKANATLRRSLSWLAHEGNLNQFLERLLLEIAATTQADLAYLFVLHKQKRTLELTARVISGELSLQPSPTEPALFSAPFSADITPAFRLMEEQNLFLTLDMAMLQPELTAIMWSGAIEWHLREGRKQVASLVLKAGDRSVGFLGLGFCEQREFSQEERELVIALAHQASLAILLIRLAEEAKLAAIAREQELAAQERAAELAKVNEALRRSATGLATIANIDDILTVFLREAIAASGASAGAVLRRVSGTEFEFVAILQGDELLRGQPLHDHPFAIAVKERSQSDVTGYFTRISNGQTVWRLAQDGTDWLPEAAEYHQMHGQQALWDIPFSVGDEVAGYLGLAFRTTNSPSTVVAEAIAALSNQVALALELTRLAEEAKQAVILEERNRMAREIHDTIAQGLSGIVIQLQAAAAIADHRAQQEHLMQARQLAELSLTEARRSVQALRPRQLDTAPLAVALARLLNQLTAATEVRSTCDIGGTPYSLLPDVESHLFRIAQEAMTNTLKHAQATQLHFQLVYQPEYVQLVVQDNGQGFDPDRPSSSSYGVMGMQERSQAIGAVLTLTSQPGEGTTIEVILPIAPGVARRS